MNISISFILRLLICFGLVTVIFYPTPASSLLRVFFKLNSDATLALGGTCYQAGVNSRFVVIDSDDKSKSNSYDGVLMIEFPLTISFIRLPAYAFGISYNAQEDLDFGLFVPPPPIVEEDCIQYTILRSFWQHLKQFSMQHNKQFEATVASSCFSSTSDMELVLIFSFNDMKQLQIANCFNYVNGFCKKSGWQCEEREKANGETILKLIITLGDEEKNDNNYQSLVLHKLISLEIENSGVREKNTKGKDYMRFFPAFVYKRTEESVLQEATEISKNTNDYAMMYMCSNNNGKPNLSVWIFPRSSVGWESPTIGTTLAVGCSLKTMESQIQSLPEIPIPLETYKSLMMAISGCLFYNNNKDSMDKVKSYLSRLNFVVRDMPSDNYCGWHAIAAWISTFRTDLMSKVRGEVRGDNSALTGEITFDFFRRLAQNMIDDGDTRPAIRTIVDTMNSGSDQSTWLDYLSLRDLVSPFIEQDIFLFDIASDGRTEDLPVQVDYLMQGRDSIRLQSNEEVINAMNHNPLSMMLLHSTNHWLLITPANQANLTGNFTLPDVTVSVGTTPHDTAQLQNSLRNFDCSF